MRVAAQDITSESVTGLLDFWESVSALWNLVHLEYIAFVCVSYYIIVTRVQFIRTNSTGRRNFLMLLLTVAWGIAQYYWRGTPVLNVIATGMFVNFCYEHIFKWAFRGLERIGWTPLPAWHVLEIQEEKRKDIARAESVKNPNQP